MNTATANAEVARETRGEANILTIGSPFYAGRIRVGDLVEQSGHVRRRHRHRGALHPPIDAARRVAAYGIP